VVTRFVAWMKGGWENDFRLVVRIGKDRLGLRCCLTLKGTGVNGQTASDSTCVVGVFVLSVFAVLAVVYRFGIRDSAVWLV